MNDTPVEAATHTTDMPQVLLEHHLKELRLPTILRKYDRVARQCAIEPVNYSRYLLRITELELLDRERAAPPTAVYGKRSFQSSRAWTASTSWLFQL
jgi:hypothetical protein